MNKDLYNRKAKLPESLKNHLQKSFEMVEGDSNTEGYNRNKELRETGIISYPVLKRVKNWFDSYQGDGKDSPYVLNGGERMSKWCNHVLDHWRGSLESGKKIKGDTGMENQYIDNHEKDGIVVNPHDKHERGINKYDTSVTEEIKKINQLFKTMK
jgi:hypothetical protein